jgi:glycosyltransferase involved in cell wall biosynthesis
MSREKRIALFTGNYNHIADGVSRTLNRLVGYLERNNISVLVFGPTIDEPAIEHAGELVVVPSVPAPGRPEYRLTGRMTREVRQRLEQYAPTIIHVAAPDVLGIQARRYARRRAIPLVATYHTHFSSYLSYYKLSVMESTVWSYLRWFYEPFHEIYVPTQSMAEVLHEQGITQGIEIWPRGVETAQFSPERRSLDWRRQHGIQEDDCVVTFVSRIVWEKGLDVFAAVVEKLEERYASVRSVIVGEGPARSALEERLARTIFLGHLEARELATAYASSDIFLFPSETETFGNVTLEAMASGVPAVCANATGSRSLVAHGETGFLVPARDIDGFYRAVEQLALDSELRRRMGSAGFERAAAYDWEAVLGKMVLFYDHILGNVV